MVLFINLKAYEILQTISVSVQDNSESIRMVLRFFLAILFGTSMILMFSQQSAIPFDNVASVGLFTCIVAVSGEDATMGPVLTKSYFRASGALIGGLCGYVMLFVPTLILPNNKEMCLVLIPTLFISLVIYLTKGGSVTISNFVKTHKASHLIIQLNAAFGVVYVGSWSNFSNALPLAIGRTVGVLMGAASLLLATLIALPQTSLQVASIELAIVLRSTAKLATMLCHDRAVGITIPPYDHRKKIFAAPNLSSDAHMKLLDTIDAKLNRVTTLRPFFGHEPSWVPGLPRTLIGKENILAKEWGPFLGIMCSRMVRIRATLTAMDSNMRIDSDKEKHYRDNIAKELENLAKKMSNALEVIAQYIESPFISSSGWRGELSLKQRLKAVFEELKYCIEGFVSAVNQEVETHGSLRNREWEEAHQLNTQTADQSTGKIIKKHSENINSSNNEDKELLVYKRTNSSTHRERLGSTIDYWHKMYPMRTFCTLAVQSAIQCSNHVLETITFMESLSDTLLKNSVEFGNNYEHGEHDSASQSQLNAGVIEEQVDVQNPLHFEKIA